MSNTLEFFFDVSSPWTYLAFHRIEDFCAGLELELIWQPFLVGGVFNKVNPSVYQRRENPVPPKDVYYRKDMEDWARYEGIVIGKPTVFPVNSVKAMRGCFHALDEGRLSAFAQGCFEAYWRDDCDISRDDVLAEIVEAAGLDKQRFFAAIADPGIKQKLFDTTDELIARGGFGSPTFFLDRDDMYFGSDRLELIRAAVERKRHG